MQMRNVHALVEYNTCVNECVYGYLCLSIASPPKATPNTLEVYPPQPLESLPVSPFSNFASGYSLASADKLTPAQGAVDSPTGYSIVSATRSFDNNRHFDFVAVAVAVAAVVAAVVLAAVAVGR
jgi:hypothetical protein